MDISTGSADCGGSQPCKVCERCLRREWRRALRARAEQVAANQDGVVSRPQLLGLGHTQRQIAAELAAGRWRAHGRHTLAVHTGELSDRARWWSAVFEVGAGAALDGVTALHAAGLTGYEDVVHVSAPKSARPRRPRGVVVHETRRRQPDDLVPSGIPRTRPAVAAVRAALWAKTDKQAALVLAMSVQQRVVAVDALFEAFGNVLRHRRRRMIAAVLTDLGGGAHSLGELEFARLCRDHGLPVPDRQSRRMTPAGTVYVDCEWKAYSVVVEIDGVHHGTPDQVLADAVRQNELTIGRDRVLRVPVLGLRTSPSVYMAQVRRLLVASGWAA